MIALMLRGGMRAAREAGGGSPEFHAIALDAPGGGLDASIRLRRGPNVVGPWGLLQSVADALKYVVKEIVVPPPDNPTPAVRVTPEWATCSSATKLVRASWSMFRAERFLPTA